MSFSKIFNNIGNAFRRLKLRTILTILSTLMVSSFLFIISYVCYRTTANILLDKLKTLENNNVKQVNVNIVSAVEEMRTYTSTLSKNQTLTNLFYEYINATDKNDYISKLSLYDLIKESFDNSNIYYKSIKGVEFYFNGGNVSNILQIDGKHFQNIKYDDFIKTDLYYNTLKSKDVTSMIEPGYQEESIDVFKSPCFGSVVYKDDEEIGYLIITMEEGWLGNLISSPNTIIYNSELNRVIWSKDDILSESYGELGSKLTNNEDNITLNVGKDKYYISYIKSDVNNWIIMTYTNIQNMFSPIKQIQNYSLIAILVSIAISFVLARYFSSRITKPIYELMQSATKYRVGNKVEFVKIESKGSNFMINMMVYFMIMVIMPLLIYSVINLSVSTKIIENEVQDSVYGTLWQTKGNIDAFMERNQRVSTNIMFNRKIQEFLISKAEIYDNNPNISNQIYNKIDEIDKYRINNILFENGKLSGSFFETVFYDREGKIIFSTTHGIENRMEPEVYNKLYGTYGESIWVNYKNNIQNSYVIGLSRKIKGILNNDRYSLKTIGYLLMMYDESSIRPLYKDIDSGDMITYIINYQGIIISHRSKSMIGKQIQYGDINNKLNDNKITYWSTVEEKGTQRVEIVYIKFGELPYILVSEVPYDYYILMDKKNIVYANLYILLLAFISAFILSYFLSYYFTKFVNMLNKELVRLGEGNMEVNFIKDNYNNEIRDLAESFNSMAQRIKRTIELEKEKKDAEIVALQAQINPHFLYNTLESVKWMNKKGDKEKVNVMITALGDLFRLGSNKDQTYIPIIDEINYAKAYVEIQKVRYGDKLEFFWFIDENISECLCPKLIIQPLIENSIYHGLHDKGIGGWIKTYVSRSGDKVIIKVIDNGVGINYDELEKIKENLGKNSGASIGIYNVQKRISLYFGDDYGLTIDSTPGQGTCVTVNIPVVYTNNL